MEEFIGTYGSDTGLPAGDVWIGDFPENDQKIRQLGYKAYRDRLYSLSRAQRPLFQYAALADPAMVVMLNHFYGMEIKKPSKINEFDLGLSLAGAIFDDYTIKG